MKRSDTLENYIDILIKKEDQRIKELCEVKIPNYLLLIQYIEEIRQIRHGIDFLREEYYVELELEEDLLNE